MNANRLFHYKAIDTNNHCTSGQISAINKRFALVELKKNHLKNIKIYLPFKVTFPKNKKISSKEIALFFQQLSAFINAGIPLFESLDLIKDDITNDHFKKIILHLKTEIASGHSLSDSMSSYPKIFHGFITHLINLGESTGTLDILLKKIEEYLEKIQRIKKRLIKAFIYPISIILVATLITAIMLIFVVPQFQMIFKNHNAPLPLMTQAVINLSCFIRSYGWILFLIFIFSTHLFFIAKRKNKTFQQFIDQLILKIPLLSIIVQQTILSKISLSLSIAIHAGTPLLTAIEFSQPIARHIPFQRALCNAHQKLSEGQSLYESLSDQNLFPSYMRNLIKTGEQSGKLDMMLEKIAIHYEESVNTFIDHLSELIEPLIMIVLGIMMGGLVIALYLPIFNLGAMIN